MNQLSFFTYVDEKEIRPFVIEELKKYKVLRVRFQNQRERMEVGADILFPELRKIDAHELKYRQLHRAFEHALDREEQQILEMKYMSATELNDDYIYTVLGMKRGKFYRKRKSGILNFATALEMI
ncbi:MULTISPECIES: ArpU family phage packaging/lysis transcriptional regulator [Bacillus]|uniref:Phage transcriptional regulator, ArpU family protein n=1 Tax=Bacillus thuringiensis YBT-1518 TaxID=529122 RepID=A0A9W3KJW4_BACTU|nr:ArpU family phage packaging/lysis transcriptional regulator [Bacillus thuringiensis]EKS8367464.1 ArpU family transcriptional regulator [Bacillus cereus]AHA74572.1 phage transcriptional regulator, ArpU family protein [Bacillus thuringiensis YBT-1518]EKS8368985.1 ArpU family transcriptional regulator [Bacillus cereus]MBG9497571.1 ArpU family transcriptional regulator [Bacillus thuringiensis]MBG9502219.1 ArpU family transcriptional regulator [Bacillus thuringiensis]